eukprot:243741_1
MSMFNFEIMAPLFFQPVFGNTFQFVRRNLLVRSHFIAGAINKRRFSMDSRMSCRPNPEKTALMICDVQEVFRDKVVGEMRQMIVASRYMMGVCRELDIPIFVTEQYPERLGKTVDDLHLSEFEHKLFTKRKFSMMTEEVQKALPVDLEHVILIGIETHVCVLQTALDLARNGIHVHLLRDATASQRQFDMDVAIERMKQLGVLMTTSESIAFQLMGDSLHPRFKAVSKLSKEYANSL